METNYSLDLALIPKELKILLEIVNMKEGEQIQTTDVERLDEINWNVFVNLALHHRVYPLICSKLKKLDHHFIPEKVCEFLYKKYKRNTFQMLYLCSEMEHVNHICTENQIRLLFLKGPVLAFELYGDVSLRTSSDIDILIPIEQLGKMEDMLIKSGYIKDDYIETILSDWKWRHHHLTYIHPEKNIKLEVHWRLNPGPGKEPNFAELWGRKRKSKLTSSPIYYLGKEDLFLFLVSHGARHGWSRLRWLLDIRQMVRQDLDWSKLCRLLKKYHCRHIGGQALILASQLLNTELNEEMEILIEGSKPKRLAQEAVFYLEKMVNLHTDPVPDEVAAYHKRHLFSLMSFQQKFLFTMSLLYPYPSDAETLPLPKALHFLYFPLRPFLWVLRKTRKHALS